MKPSLKSLTLVQLVDYSYVITGANAAGLLRTKQNEDPGFEIIKEVPGSGKSPFGMLQNNPSLSALATLMGGAGPNAAGMSAAGLMGHSNILQKCKCF